MRSLSPVDSRWISHLLLVLLPPLSILIIFSSSFVSFPISPDNPICRSNLLHFRHNQQKKSEHLNSDLILQLVCFISYLPSQASQSPPASNCRWESAVPCSISEGGVHFMGPPSILITKKPLDGIHGLRVKSYAPFSVEPIHQDADYCQSQCTTSSISTSQGFLMQRAWQQRPDCMRPIHYCCNGDQSVAETIANVITSLPFIALGIQVPRKNLHCKMYANSLIGVGAASSLYHCSRGTIRMYLRWVDYTMIAASTVCLSRAIRNENPKLLMAASALCLPFQPLLVSAVHTGMMEMEFAKRAIKNPKLRTAHNVHKLSSLLSGALFVADDLYPKTPFLHAAWHLTAAVGVGTCNKLLE